MHNQTSETICAITPKSLPIDASTVLTFLKFSSESDSDCVAAMIAASCSAISSAMSLRIWFERTLIACWTWKEALKACFLTFRGAWLTASIHSSLIMKLRRLDSVMRVVEYRSEESTIFAPCDLIGGSRRFLGLIGIFGHLADLLEQSCDVSLRSFVGDDVLKCRSQFRNRLLCRIHAIR